MSFLFLGCARSMFIIIASDQTFVLIKFSISDFVVSAGTSSSMIFAGCEECCCCFSGTVEQCKSSTPDNQDTVSSSSLVLSVLVMFWKTLVLFWKVPVLFKGFLMLFWKVDSLLLEDLGTNFFTTPRLKFPKPSSIGKPCSNVKWSSKYFKIPKHSSAVDSWTKANLVFFLPLCGIKLMLIIFTVEIHSFKAFSMSLIIVPSGKLSSITFDSAIIIIWIWKKETKTWK